MQAITELLRGEKIVLMQFDRGLISAKICTQLPMKLLDGGLVLGSWFRANPRRDSKGEADSGLGQIYSATRSVKDAADQYSTDCLAAAIDSVSGTHARIMDLGFLGDYSSHLDKAYTNVVSDKEAEFHLESHSFRNFICLGQGALDQLSTPELTDTERGQIYECDWLKSFLTEHYKGDGWLACSSVDHLPETGSGVTFVQLRRNNAQFEQIPPRFKQQGPAMHLPRQRVECGHNANGSLVSYSSRPRYPHLDRPDYVFPPQGKPYRVLQVNTSTRTAYSPTAGEGALRAARSFAPSPLTLSSEHARLHLHATHCTRTSPRSTLHAPRARLQLHAQRARLHTPRHAPSPAL